MDHVKFLRRQADFFLDEANRAVDRNVFQRLCDLASVYARQADEYERGRRPGLRLVRCVD